MSEGRLVVLGFTAGAPDGLARFGISDDDERLALRIASAWRALRQTHETVDHRGIDWVRLEMTHHSALAHDIREFHDASDPARQTHVGE